MDEATPLDRAHARMEAAGEDDEGARRAYYDRLAAAELFLLVEEEARQERVSPMLARVDGASFALAFDREDRLAAFAGDAAPYLALGGRALTGMLADEGLGLALNPDVAPSAYLLPPEAVAWIAETAGVAPDETADRPERVMPPETLPEAWLEALDARLAAMAGLARVAWLAGVEWADGRQGHLVAVEARTPDVGAAVARAVSDCTALVGQDIGEVSVVVLAPGDRLAERIARVGLRFDLPQTARPDAPTPPGSDPDRPPRLR